MTSSQSVTTSTTDTDLAQLIAAGTVDPRVAAGLQAFQVASARVPVPTVTYSPVTYSTSGNG